MSQTEAQQNTTPTTLLGLGAAARLIPSLKGKPTHPATLIRWILNGVRLTNGQSFKLAARKYPGGWATTREAIEEFVDTLTRDRCGEPVPAKPMKPTARRQAEINRAEHAADLVGI